MNERNNPYNYHRQGQMMPPPMPPVPPRGKLQWRAMNAIRQAKMAFPSWLAQYGIVTYLLSSFVVAIMYSTYSIPWYYWLSGIISIVVFFLYGKFLTDKLSGIRVRSVRNFERRIFLISIIARIAWVFLSYFLFMQNYGDAFGIENGDAPYYHDLGVVVHRLIGEGNFHFIDEITSWNGGHDDISDMGYGIYVGFVYWLTGNSIIAVRLFKSLWSALTVLLIYRLARRNFGEQTARVAAIFVALWPNFWYYCGTHLKETEMVFLGVLFVEQADQMLRSRQFTAWKVIPVLLIGVAILGFRTPLALVAFLALIFSIVMSSSKVVNWGKRIIVGGLVLLLVAVTMGNRIQEEAMGLIDTVQSGQQERNMEWRSTRKDGGNAFAKYAGKTVFAPLIFTIPFPSMVRPFEGQDGIQLLNGGNFVKNIISFFTIFAMVMLLISGKWRDHMLPLAYMLGYLVVLTMSTFAQSERFHQPAMPFEFMFVAYGLSIAVTKPKYKRWFMYWCGLMFVAAIAWNWFKLAGRGLA